MAVEDLVDPRRVDPPFVAGERDMLEAWLEFHRMTLLLKCEGAAGADLDARPVSTSELSLHGLVRHAAEVERNWFSRVLQRAPDTPQIFIEEGVEEADFECASSGDWDQDLATWQRECARSREVARKFDLDDTGLRRGQEVSLRWIYVHLIEEYARHNGHADLIREMVDSAVGG